MMEKRNFVTSARTPMEGASDIDDIVDIGMRAFGQNVGDAVKSAFEKAAAAKDEESDRG